MKTIREFMEERVQSVSWIRCTSGFVFSESRKAWKVEIESERKRKPVVEEELEEVR